MDEINEKLKFQCLKKWGEENRDEKIERFEIIYDKWIESIPIEHRDLIYKLIEKFEYYGHSYVNKKLSELYFRVNDKYSIDNNETLYTYIEKSDSVPGSSIEYMLLYLNVNNISQKNFCINIKKIKDYKSEYIKNIVLIDDYSGSGESIIKYLTKNLSLFVGKNIYILLVTMSIDAKLNVEKEFMDKDLNIYMESINIEPKAFSKIGLNDDEIETKKEEFKTLSVKKEIKNDVFGKNDTEGLVAFYNNTPNNTLKIFWKKTSKNNPLFPRTEKEIPNWRKMKKKKKQRKFENANNYRRCDDG